MKYLEAHPEHNQHLSGFRKKGEFVFVRVPD